jgi:hypothetical protein
MSNFLREVQLFVGPLSEVEGGGDSKKAIILNSSGLDRELNISFKVDKNTMGSPNFSTITLYNLSTETRQALSKVKTNLQLQAGYKTGNSVLQTIAQGAIASVISERNDGDIKMTINAYDGGEGLGVGRFSKSYQGQIELGKIVKDIADTIPGASVSSSNIVLGNQKVGTKGMTFSGRTKTILDKLARSWGFDWSIQGGVFKAIPDQATSNNTFEVSTELGNLIHVTPRLDNVLQIITGIDITAVLDPRFQPYDSVKLVSTVAPELNNTYKITNLTHQGDIRGDVWTTTLQCLFFFDQITPSGVTT